MYNMRRRIPLHLPQILPPEWEQTTISTVSIPTEENLTRNDDDNDDFYNAFIRIGFDTKALVYAAMHAFSTSEIPQITKGPSGSFNRVFSIQFSDGFRVAARISTPQRRATPNHTASTVAMMTFARYCHEIPVPEVYAWYPDTDSPVGAPYTLLEWVEGDQPWQQWYDLPVNDRTEFLDQLADYHAKFAKPLPFRGIGSIYFQELPANAGIDFGDLLMYRLGPLSRSPACTMKRGISTWPETIPTSSSLREFWLELWKHEVDSITSRFGFDCSTIIDGEDDPDIPDDEKDTLGQFLDAVNALLVLIQNCPLPLDSSSDLYYLSLVSTDYAFRNIIMDPESRKIKAFLDWDDVYMMPFILCSRYPEDICDWWGAGEAWHETGSFEFIPPDEDGEIDEDSAVAETATIKEDSETVSNKSRGSLDDVPEDSEEDSVDVAEDLVEDTDGKEISLKPDSEPYVSPEDALAEAEYKRQLRIKDTRFRRQYAQLLTHHDARFGTEGFWKMREEPLKLQHLLMRGWIEWIAKESWLKKRAVEELSM